jgi:hypothetical protein
MWKAVIALGALLTTSSPAQVLFSDDFNDGDAAGWQELDGQFSIVNGAYRIQSQSFCGDARAVNGNPGWTDYAVDLDFYIDSAAPNRAAAILFRVADIVSGCDAGQYYQLHVTPASVGFCKMNYSQGSCQGLAGAAYATSAFIWHHARLEVVGQTATAFIDGQEVLTYNGFTDYASGRIGVKAINGNANVYDNVVVTALHPPTIGSVSPAMSSLAGGVAITISGSGFWSGSTVLVGGVPLVSPNIVDSQTITGITPPLPTPQVADVSITNLSGSTTLAAAVTFDHAVLITPNTAALGSTVELRVASYASKPHILLFDSTPGPTSLGYLGTAAIGLSQAVIPIADFFGAFTGVVDPTAITGATGQWSIQVVVPTEPQLVNLTVFGQAYVFSFSPLPPNQYFFFSNPSAITVVP